MYESLIKFGWKNHLWDIIEECNDEQLFEKEKYYIKKYKVNIKDRYVEEICIILI